MLPGEHERLEHAVGVLGEQLGERARVGADLGERGERAAVERELAELGA